MTIQQKGLNHQQLQRKYLKAVVQPKKLTFTNLKKSSNEMNIPSKIYNQQRGLQKQMYKLY